MKNKLNVRFTNIFTSKLSKKWMTFAFIFSVFVTACNKDIKLDAPMSQATPSQAESLNFDMSEAKDYFTKNALYKQGRQDPDLFSPIIHFQPEPLWDVATKSTIGDCVFWEVPLKCNKERADLGASNWKEQGTLPDKVSQLDVLNYFRLIIMKNKNGTLEARFMITTPEKQYAQSKIGLSEMRNCRFNDPPYNFDGGTLYYGLDGKYLTGVSYSKGLPVETVTQVKKDAFQGRDLFCSWMATTFAYTITVGVGPDAVTTWHADIIYAFRCIDVASRDYSPWVWNNIINPLPPPPLPTSVTSLIPAGGTICPGSFLFYSNSEPGFPSTQKSALFKNFTVDFRVGSTSSLPVEIAYASLLFENYVTQQDASNFFKSALNLTQTSIDGGAISSDATPAAVKSQIRSLFFNTYNNLAFNTTGFGPMNYFLESYRSANYSKPTACP